MTRLLAIIGQKILLIEPSVYDKTDFYETRRATISSTPIVISLLLNLQYRTSQHWYNGEHARGNGQAKSPNSRPTTN
jgi:hypothetical protein